MSGGVVISGGLASPPQATNVRIAPMAIVETERTAAPNSLVIYVLGSGLCPAGATSFTRSSSPSLQRSADSE